MSIRVAFSLICSCALWLGTLAWSAESTGDSPQSGLLAGHLTFEGLSAFSEHEIQRALNSRIELVVAKEQKQPLRDYLQKLQRALRAGYENAGFSEARIDAGINSASNGILVRVTEGPRYYCGSVLVSADEPLDTNSLVRLVLRGLQREASTNELMAAKSGESTAARTEVGSMFDPQRRQALLRAHSRWNPGYPAALDPESWAIAEQAVTNAFWNLGYAYAEFTVDFPKRAPEQVPATQNSNQLSEAELNFRRARADGRVVDLLIQVTKTGPLCTVTQLETRDSERTREQDLASFLKFQPGERFTLEWVQQRYEQLENSGRFVEILPSHNGGERDGKVTAVFSLKELTQAPPLRQPLSPEAEVLLRMRKWLLDWTNRTEDLVLRYWQHNRKAGTTNVVEFVSSPSGAVSIRAAPAAENTAYLQVMVRPEFAGFCLADFSEKIVTTNFPLAVTARIEIGPKANVGPDESPMNLTFGGGFENARETKPAFRVQMELASSAFTYFSCRTGLTWRLEPGYLSVSSSNIHVRVETNTGRLISFRGSHEEDDAPAFLQRADWTLEFENGAFRKAHTEWERSTAGATNAFEPARGPASSIACLARGIFELAALDVLSGTNVTAAKAAAARKAARKLISPELFAGIEDLAPVAAPPEEHRFYIPAAGFGPSERFSQIFTPVAILLGNIEKLVGTGSWLDLAVKIPLLRFAGQSAALDVQGERLNELIAEDRVGPLAALVLGSQLSPPGSRQMGIHGLMRMDAPSFLTDLRFLQDGTNALGRSATVLATSLTALNEEELAGVSALLSQQNAALLAAAVNALRQNPGQSPFSSLQPQLEQIWSGALKEAVRNRLREFTRARVTEE